MPWPCFIEEALLQMHVIQITTDAAAFEQALHIAYLESGLGMPLDQHAGRNQRLKSIHAHLLCGHACEFTTRERIKITGQMQTDVTCVIFGPMNKT